MLNPKIKIFTGTNAAQLETEINSFLEDKLIVDIKTLVAANFASTILFDYYTFTVIYCE